ncbi:MAG: hypothetical protein JWQ83_1785 [Lacunisphaera sp.]|nr:hypothetical protein [Lacunisphaera sp.]
MPANNLVLYGLNRLGPYNIGSHAEYVRKSGFTTVVMGMLHIGNPAVKSTTQLGDIIFNGDEPLVIRDGAPPFPLVEGRQKAECEAWPGEIAGLKDPSSPVTKIYASVGGAAGIVRDFETIKAIYEANKNTFDNTGLERNFRALKRLFPAIDGIDMDCEETYDLPSFVAFCVMLQKIGFDLTFCPFSHFEQEFWVNALFALHELSLLRYVKWVNLQCYAGGSRNIPEEWATAIGKRFRQPPLKDFVVPGRAARFKNDEGNWDGECPQTIAEEFSKYRKDLFSSGFIWEMDLIIATENGKDKDKACSPGEPITLAAYAGALKKGLGG